MSLSPKDPAEIVDITFDFSTQYTSVTSPEITCTVAGSKTDIPSMKVTLPYINPASPNKVLIRIGGGDNGKKYDLRCKVTTNTGETVVAKGVLTVKTL